MNTPVVIVFFNRIEPLKKLVARLAEVKPKKVYLVSDGARSSKIGEADQVEECRKFMQKLPWECEIKCNFASANMGCRCRVTSGLDWVFEQEERAIILEDDCIPEVVFFDWVEEMLERFKDNEKVLSISGTNLRPQICDKTKDCTFTKYAMVWGWATWRRAWHKNDKNLELLEGAIKTHHLRKWLGSWRAELYWKYLLTHVLSSWGYRWAFTHFVNKGFCAIPPVCLVENIGMTGSDATHTSNNPYELSITDGNWRSNGNSALDVIPNDVLDRWVEDHQFSRSFFERLKWILNKIKIIFK